MPTPAYVQVWNTQGSLTVPETSRTITCGTSGSGAANPTAGNRIIIFVGLSTFATPGLNTPTGTTARGSIVDTAAENRLYAFDYPVATTGSVSFAFTFASSFAMIFAIEVSAAQFDILTTATAAPTATPWASPTGTGTQTGLNDLGLVFAAIGDGAFDPNALSGYTLTYRLSATGDGGATSYGGSFAVLRSNALITAASVPSQNVPWPGVGSEFTVGMQYLAAPAASIWTQSIADQMRLLGVLT